MKLNKLALACGVAIAGFGVQVSAATVNVYISGSSALTPSLEKAVSVLCDSAKPQTDRNIFRSSTGSAYQCTSKASVFGGVAKTIEIRKRNSGGSGLGVMNVASSTLTGFTDPASGACAAAAAVTINGVTFNQKTGCTDANLIPTAGMSDVEPELFASQGYNGGLSKAPIVGAMFGVPVSEKLYRQLQALQGISESGASFDPAKAPVLTSAQVRSMFTGSYNDWTLVNPGIVTAGGALASTAVKVCRRVATSGSQMTINARLLNNPCGNAASASLPPTDNTNDDNLANDTVPGDTSYSGVFTAVMNPGSTDVVTCLNAADNQNELAVGLLGAEFTPAATDKWHFVKLDGVFPNVANLVSSAYDLYSEASFNRRASGYSADQTTMMNKLVATMGDPAFIPAGAASLPANGFTPDGIQPILKGGRGGNTCSPTTLQF
ncbi:MAG: hypothetical protein M3A44_05875 [Gammaproteobacteria bacterium]